MADLKCFELQVNGFHLMGQKCVLCESLIGNAQLKIQKAEKLQKAAKKADVVQKGFDDILQLQEKYKDCECCQGMVFDCEGEICSILGKCYCYEKDQQDLIGDQ